MRSKLPAYLLPQLRDIFFIVIFVSVLALGNRMLNLDGDLPRHLLTGKYVLQTRSIPATEPFAYPYTGRTYVSHEWLADVAYYLIYSVFGLAGIVVFGGLLLATTFTVLYSALVHQNALRLPTLLILAWGAGVTSLNWVVRPHLISMMLLALWLVQIDKLARGEKSSLWKFPLIMALWGNLHGEFIAGILVILAYASGWVWDFLFDRPNANPRVGRNLGLGLILSVLASLFNPAGVRPWTTILGFVNNSYLMSRMAESNSPDFHHAPFNVLLALLAFSIAMMALKREKIAAGRAFTLAGFSAMSLIAVRNIHLYGVVAPFVLAAPLSDLLSVSFIHRLENTLQAVESQLRGIVWPVATTFILGGFLLGTNAGNFYHFSPTFFPVDAVRWLESNPQKGNLFNNLDWGGYVALHLWPDQRVFIDSMADVTGELTMEYERVVTLYHSWENVLADNNVEWALIPPGSKLATALSAHGWQPIYQDDTAIILRK